MVNDRVTEYRIHKVQQWAELELRNRHDWLFRWVLSGCESPIEQLLAIALALTETDWCQLPRFYGSSRPESGFFVPEDEHCAIYTQAEILNYRVDFLLVFRTCVGDKTHKLVVECDGHDYHERTKEQARRDKSRDRALVTEGYQVLRFTGSEIYRDPDKCVADIYAVIKRIDQEAVAEHMSKGAPR